MNYRYNANLGFTKNNTLTLNKQKEVGPIPGLTSFLLFHVRLHIGRLIHLGTTCTNEFIPPYGYSF